MSELYTHGRRLSPEASGEQTKENSRSLLGKAGFLTWESVSWNRSLKAMYTRKEFTPGDRGRREADT